MAELPTSGAVRAPMHANTPVLQTDHLTRIYDDGHVTALDDVTLRIHAGEYVAIMGPSGSGKSTLLQLLGGLDRPSSGRVLLEGQPLFESASLDRIRRELFGFVFQSFHLLPNLTVTENVQLPMFGTGRSARQRLQRALELLPIVGMARRARHLASQLSVGERQRTAIARALANDPRVLLADEPTGNLDSRTGEDVLELFGRLNRDRAMTIVMITHDAQVAACASRVLHLRDGRVDSDSASSAGPGHLGTGPS